MSYTDFNLLFQEGFAPPDDDEIDEAAQGDQDEFWTPRLFITFINQPPPLSPFYLPENYCHNSPFSPLFDFLRSPYLSHCVCGCPYPWQLVAQPSFPKLANDT